MEKYEPVKVLGCGAFGVVYLEENITTGDLVAIKHITKPLSSKKNFMTKVVREIVISRQLTGHKNITSFIEYSEDDKKIYIVYDYIHSSLPLTHWPIPDITTREGRLILLDVIYQLVEAYQFIHSQKIVHRDIKPANIVMKGNIPIIIDFDMACIFTPDSKYPCRGLAGTPNYLAPEVWLQHKDIDYYLTDIYSLGVVLYYLINDRKVPYMGDSVDELRDNVLNVSPLPSSSGFRELDECIMLMINKDPQERINLQIVKDIIQRLIKEV